MAKSKKVTRKRSLVPRNAVGVMKDGKGYRFVVKGKKVPRSLLRKSTRRKRRVKRSRKRR